MIRSKINKKSEVAREKALVSVGRWSGALARVVHVPRRRWERAGRAEDTLIDSSGPAINRWHSEPSAEERTSE